MPPAFGIGLYYDGGPLRLNFRFRADPPGWGSGVRFGLGPVEQVRLPARDEPRRNGPSLCLSYLAFGSSDQTIRRWGLMACGRDGREASYSWPTDRCLPLSDRDYACEIEYIPGLDKAFVSVRESDGKILVPPTAIEMPFRFERGHYIVGHWPETSSGTGSPGYHARYLVKSLKITASLATTPVALSDLRNVRARLLWANGRLALGDVEAARIVFDETVIQARTAEQTATLGLACLGRSLAHYRLGRMEDARGDLKAASDSLGKQGLIRILQSTGRAGSLEERTFLLCLLGKDPP
jgi:hypothetical protein